jgi:hypothetical protein
VKKNSRPRLHGLCALVLFALVAMILPFPSLAGDKLKPEEIVAKNLESIGTAEARAKVNSRIVGGTVVATFVAPGTAQFEGRAVLASEGNKNLINMQFDSANYSQESISFDGENVSVAYARAGVRSNLGDLVWTYRPIVKQGLVGGELSQAWPLYNLSVSKPKLSGGGTKKIGDKVVYVVKLMPRGGSDLEISVYFDSQTFQHVRTEYSQTIVPQLGANVDASASQRPTRYKVTEDFSDFKKEGELTLPHSYKISLELDTRIPFRGSWELTLNQFGFNQPIPPEMFTSGAKP